MTDFIQDYIDFQNICLSPFHVVETLKQRLLKKNFQELSLHEAWTLKVSKSYFVIHPSGKSVVSFQVGKKSTYESGFALIGAHTDSPVLRLKLNPWGNQYGYQVLYNECHGSLILRSWLDRPLLLAGKIHTFKRDKNKKPIFNENGLPQVETQLVHSKEPVAIIPDLAIHLDREKNEFGKINPETMMLAITGCEDKMGAYAALQKSLACGEFDGFDLNLTPYWPHCRVGAKKEFITGPRHDDLVMVYTAQCAMESASQKDAGAKTSVAAFFDSEETGSQTYGGAASYFIVDVLTRLHNFHPLNSTKEALGQSFAKSFVISGDVAHGIHPAHRERHDMNHKPTLNGGLVLKSNANDKYATTGYGQTVFKALCESVNAPYQDFCARGDLGCGSTIGPILSTKLGCETIDVGIALWSMHSAAETIGAFDIKSTVQIFERFYAG